MASALEKRLATLEAAAGLTEPDRLHIILTDYGTLGPDIPPQRIARPGKPDLLITTERRLWPYRGLS